MDRRQYLRAGIALACTTSAGCLDKVSTGSNDDETTTNVSDRTGERALARSVGRLNEAALALNVGSTLENGDVKFDPKVPREHIAAARKHLDTAAKNLGSDRQPDIGELRAYASVLEALVDVTETVTNDQLESEIDAVSAALKDRRLEEASTIADELAKTFDEAKQRFDTAFSDLKSLDAKRLEALSIVDLEKVMSGVSTLGTVLTSMIALVDALTSALGGYKALKRGKKHADNGDYKSAKKAFSEAKSEFTTSATTLEGERDNAPAALDSYFETGLCRNGHLKKASDHLIASAEAAMNRNPIKARQRREDAEKAISAAKEC